MSLLLMEDISKYANRHMNVCMLTCVCAYTHIVIDSNNPLKVRGQGLFGEHIRKGLDEEVALKQI